MGAPHARQRVFLVAAQEGSFWDLRGKTHPRAHWAMREFGSGKYINRPLLPTVLARDGERGSWAGASSESGGSVAGRPLSEVILAMAETLSREATLTGTAPQVGRRGRLLG